MDTIARPASHSPHVATGRIGMADALFGGAQQPVLALLFGMRIVACRTVDAALGAELPPT